MVLWYGRLNHDQIYPAANSAVSRPSSLNAGVPTVDCIGGSINITVA
jgi:hypothetical protein